jgi:DNA-binding MarR family transcriptional regulator
MNQSTRPSHYSLNQKQLYILKLTYKFRFITAPLLARHRNVSVSSKNIVINRLYKQGYLGRHYDKKTHKLPNRPATYYLQNKAIRYLRDNTSLSDKGLNACYKDKHLNQKFIDNSLLVYKTFLYLREKHPDYIFFTANELRDFDHFPKILPQLYYYTETQEGERKEIMLDIFTENLFFYIKKRIDQYIAHYEEGEWLRSQYPTIVLIVPDARLKAKAENYFESARDGVFADEKDLQFIVQAGMPLITR